MSDRFDEMRMNALERARDAELRFHAAVAALLFAEALLVSCYLISADLHNPLHRLILYAAGIVYVPLVVGLIALGAHVNRAAWRIIATLSSRSASDSDV